MDIGVPDVLIEGCDGGKGFPGPGARSQEGEGQFHSELLVLKPRCLCANSTLATVMAGPET